ncbi:MAG: CPBP family intramembrane glutamic endopeptidase [Actinomycetota bacterium]
MLRAATDDATDPVWPRADADVRWGIGAAMACFLGAQVLAGVWATIVVASFFVDGLPELADRPMWALPVLGIGLWAGYLGGPILINRLSGSGPMLDFDLRVSPAQAAMAAVIGVAMQLAVLPPLYWVIERFVTTDPSETAEAIVGAADGLLDVVLLVFAVVIMAPLAEEWFYRGMVLSSLVRRIGPIAGAVISSAVFALIHLELILLPGLFLLALVLAWLTMRIGRVGVAIVAHLAFNATTVVQLLVFGA